MEAAAAVFIQMKFDAGTILAGERIRFVFLWGHGGID
jgi:hypothetical protein